jgi:cell wall-associated NlpC family hydrolase
MGRDVRARFALVGTSLRRGLERKVAPARLAMAKAAGALWRRRFHWPVVALAGVMAAAAALPAAMSSPALSVAARDPVTYSASSWPGLLHQKAPATAVSSTPTDAVPACAWGGSSTSQLTAAMRSTRPPSRPAAKIIFTGLLAPTPVVGGVTPTSGPATGGTTVVITGSGLSGATAVLFGVVPALSFSVVSDTEITAASPPGLGTENIQVLTLGGLSATSASDQFTYLVPSPPTLPTVPGLPGAPSAPGLPTGGTSTTTGGSGGGGTSSSPTSGASPGSPTLPGAPGTLPSNAPLTPPAITPSGSLPSFGYGFGDGILGCNLIDNSTGAKVAGESAAQARAVQLALSFIGTPYVWGGESTHGFDCSGLVQFVFSAAGVSLPRVAQAQYDAGPAVAPGTAVVPGDLIFFGSGPSDVSHVGIFVGNGVMVDAPHTGADVRLDQINGFEPIVGVTSPGQ